MTILPSPARPPNPAKLPSRPRNPRSPAPTSLWLHMQAGDGPRFPITSATGSGPTWQSKGLGSVAGEEGKTYKTPTLKRIAHFEIIEHLGTGAFGTVWKARDTKLDRTVAIKIPRQQQLDEEDVERFLREATAAAQLKHPSIVSVHEVGREAGRLYIVSDFVRGVSLDEWLTA